MKYVIAVAVIVLMAGAVYLGFDVGKNNTNSVNDSADSSQNESAANEHSSAGAKVLDLSGTGLTKVTSDIYNKTDTTDLLLSNNSIKALPSEMGKMTNLIIFKIDHNALEGSLIAEVRQMSKLKQLDVSYNNMTGIPAEIGQLSNLQSLNYSYNKIDSFPNELGNLKNSLKEFNLTGNPLSEDKINKLKTQLPNTNIIF